MTFNKAFRVCVLASSLTVGLLGCDNEGMGGSGPSLSAESGGADPGSLRGETGRGSSFSGESTPSTNFGESQAPSPGSLSSNADEGGGYTPPGGGGGGGGGGSCSLATACDDYKKALTNFVKRSCANAGQSAAQCERSLQGTFGEFDSACRSAISSGQATPAQVCEALGCFTCFFDKATATTGDVDFCSFSACNSVCKNICLQIDQGDNNDFGNTAR